MFAQSCGTTAECSLAATDAVIMEYWCQQSTEIIPFVTLAATDIAIMIHSQWPPLQRVHKAAKLSAT